MKKLKILIEMKHGLGDCICMLPAIKLIRDTYPDAYIAILVNGKINEELFELSKIKIDKYYYFSLKNRSKLYTLKTLYKLRKERFDIGILATMTPASKGKGLFKLLGIKRCFGEQYQGIKEFSLDNSVHFVDRNLSVIKELCSSPETLGPRLYAEEPKTDKFIQLLQRNRPIIGVNIGGGDKNFFKGQYVYTRNWGNNNMHRLLELLSDLSEYDIVLLGGPLEAGLVEDYGDILIKDNVFNFVNKTTIGETFYLLSRCKLSVGVDTGMQHAADALGVNTVSIFGPTNPLTHGAYSDKASFILSDPKVSCQYCFGRKTYYTCKSRDCLDNITPGKVFSRVKDVLTEIAEV